MTMRNARLALLPALALLLGALCLPGRCLPGALAQEKAEEAKSEAPKGTTFHFGLSAKHTSVTFESETSVETIHGVVNAISGSATLDFEEGKGATELTIPVEAMKTGIEARDGHMRSEDWLDAKKHPDIVFKAKTLKRVKKADEKSPKETWAFEGSITIKGISKDLKGEATVQRVPEESGKVLGRGSWVKVKTAFTVDIEEFGIKVPEHSAAKVSPTWDIKIDLFGTTEKPAR